MWLCLSNFQIVARLGQLHSQDFCSFLNRPLGSAALIQPPMGTTVGVGLALQVVAFGRQPFEGRFRRVQKFCEGGRNALLFGLTCQDKAHDSFPILCRSLGSARDANNCKYTQGACE